MPRTTDAELQPYFNQFPIPFRFVHTKDKFRPYTLNYINTEVGYHVYDFDRR